MIFNLDTEVILYGSLLHDIGHTPFGHAGERTLHEILSGRDDCYGLVKDIKALGIEQGFKHNINSGLLYKEAAGYKAGYFTMNKKVLDAIIKHTKIFYDKNKEDSNLDYGLQYVVSGFKDFESKAYFNHNPNFVEGYIISIADEIAQMGSDYLDLMYFNEDLQNEMNTTKLYHIIGKKNPSFENNNYRNQASIFVSELINLFVEEMKKVKDGFMIDENSEFMSIMNEIKQIKDKHIKNNLKIKLFDDTKATIIKTLFGYYYKNPWLIEKGIFCSFCEAIMLTKGLTKEMYIKIDELSIINKIKNENEIMILKKSIVDFVYRCRDNINNPLVSKKAKKSCKIFYKIFVRYIAVYISKMTDSYADDKYNKIINPKE